MKKIVLTHSYFIKFDPKQEQGGNAYPPLGTLILASCLKNSGFEVIFHDSMFASSADEISSVLVANTPQLLIICDDAFNYLTKMCLSNMREAAFEMIKIAKSQGIPVIVNSSDASDHFQQYLNQGADYVVLGESEPTTIELVDFILIKKADGSAKSIQNIAYIQDGNLIKNPKREVLKDLDSLPFAAWDLVDIERYKAFRKLQNVPFSMNMVTTRGCPYKCNWCAKPIYGNRYNTRSPHLVVQELKYLVEKYGVEHIWFADDIFGLKTEWIENFSSLMGESGIKIRYKIQSRADLLSDEETVKALSESGCEEVWLGAESGSQHILDAMDKGVTVEQIKTSRNLLKQYGIKTAFFLQFGYLGETEKDINATIKMVLELMPEDIGISVSYPLPGTKFYEKVKNDLKVKTNWTDSDELAMMFNNTYPSAYYRYLQKYVHAVYRIQKAKNELGNFRIGSKVSAKSLPRKAAGLVYHNFLAQVHKVKMNRSKIAKSI